jgi:hypothetical protein
MTMLIKTDKTNILIISTFATISFAILLLWILVGGLDAIKSKTITDVFSSLSTLFSGLAFSGLICTIFIQQSELKLTRDELRRSADANEESSKIAKLQIASKYYSTVMENANTIFSQQVTKYDTNTLTNKCIEHSDNLKTLELRLKDRIDRFDNNIL